MNNILIITEAADQSTNDVIDWIIHYGYSVTRVNEDTDIQFVRCNIDTIGQINFFVSVKGVEYNLMDFHSIWYRRGDFNLARLYNFSSLDVPQGLANFYQSELGALTKFAYHLLASKRSLNEFHHVYINKLEVLKMATQVGLPIPALCIGTTKSDLLKFSESYPRCITKAINIGANISTDEIEYSGFTAALAIDQCESIFFPTMIQPDIPKYCDVRIFYINATFYAMAIFSQQDIQTATDFRVYNEQRPNRTEPINLPLAVQTALMRLMTYLKMNCGSIDMILDTEGTFVFLEVNPIGQFYQVSYPCNYQLERKIAEYLCGIR